MFGGQWYVAVPISELPKEIEASALETEESVDDTEARIAGALSVWLYRKSKRYNPHKLHLKQE